MQLNFRQGLVRHQAGISGTPTFLRVNADHVDLVCDDGPVQFTVAHFNADYLFEETRTLTSAWGPFPTPSSTLFYLYWDISILDASISHGFTAYPPYTSDIAPPLQVDQHWFDTNVDAMKVWNGSKWLVKLRVFAGTYNGSTLTPYQNGTQVGLTGGPFSPGNIVLGKNSYPLRDSDGTFITTESGLIIAGSSGMDVKLGAAIQFGSATAIIPGYTLVSYVAPTQIAPASYTDATHQVNGIIVEDAFIGEIMTIYSSGVIVNPQWNWISAGGTVGQTLFCGLHGEITTTPPQIGAIQPIGYIYDNDKIFMSILTQTKL